MLDGDRIAILCAVFFNELVSAAGLKMNLGIVQTAYANGGSTKCLEKLGAWPDRSCLPAPEAAVDHPCLRAWPVRLPAFDGLPCCVPPVDAMCHRAHDRPCLFIRSNVCSLRTNVPALAPGIPVACAKTGVKHLHHLALNYDIGVYFEANGHGTILFSDDALGVIAKANGSTNAEKKALTDLRSLIDLINQV